MNLVASCDSPLAMETNNLYLDATTNTFTHNVTVSGITGTCRLSWCQTQQYDLVFIPYGYVCKAMGDEDEEEDEEERKEIEDDKEEEEEEEEEKPSPKKKKKKTEEEPTKKSKRVHSELAVLQYTQLSNRNP